MSTPFATGNKTASHLTVRGLRSSGPQHATLARFARAECLRVKPPSDHNMDMRDEYDFTRGARGKYAKRFAQGSNVVVLD